MNLLELRFGPRDGREVEVEDLTFEQMGVATERVMDREAFPDEGSVLAFEGRRVIRHHRARGDAPDRPLRAFIHIEGPRRSVSPHASSR